MSKLKLLDEIARIKNIDGFQSNAWKSIDPKFVARMSLQNRFKTGLDIARYTADIMRKDMDAYDKDATIYTCLLYTSPSPRDKRQSRMPSSA